MSSSLFRDPPSKTYRYAAVASQGELLYLVMHATPQNWYNNESIEV